MIAFAGRPDDDEGTVAQGSESEALPASSNLLIPQGSMSPSTATSIPSTHRLSDPNGPPQLSPAFLAGSRTPTVGTAVLPRIRAPAGELGTKRLQLDPVGISLDQVLHQHVRV